MAYKFEPRAAAAPKIDTTGLLTVGTGVLGMGYGHEFNTYITWTET
jgi:hypothetical protein